jgi:hypothetical protein
LLEELLERVVDVGTSTAVCVGALRTLRDRCLQADTKSRPSFDEIEKTLP